MTAGTGVLLWQGQPAAADNISPSDLVDTQISVERAEQRVQTTKQSLAALATKRTQLERAKQQTQTTITSQEATRDEIEARLVPEERSFFSDVLSSVLPSAKAEAEEAETTRSEWTRSLEETEAALAAAKQKQQDLTSSYEAIKQKQADVSATYTQRKAELSDLKKQYEAMAPNQFLMPATGRLSQGFGPASGQFGYTFHNGIDIAAAIGTPIVAAAAGEVIEVNGSGPYGKHVKMRHTLDGKTWTTVYAHMNQIDVKRGDSIRQGEPIGEIGNTGNSSGPHLHFEIHEGDYQFSASAPGNTIDPMRVVERLNGASPVKATF